MCPSAPGVCPSSPVFCTTLAVVKVTLQVNGNSQFLGVCPQKTMWAIKIKSGTNDYVGEGNPHAKNLVTVELRGAAPHMGEI